jgi:L-rhamnose 1-dehydrogenase
MAPAHWLLLDGKTAAITGGTTGIGRAIALEFLKQGCNVAINHLGLSKDEHHKDSLLREAQRLLKDSNGAAGKCIEIQGNVTDPETGKKLVEAAVEKWGRLDVFVSNAGVCKFAEFLA